MKLSITKFALLVAVLAGFIATMPVAMADGKHARTYWVTVTNAMLGQPVAPSVIATHSNAFNLFELGPAPMVGDARYDDYFALATMAETGFPFLVQEQVAASYGVWEAVVLATDRMPPVLLPSESNSVEISASGRAKYLTAVAMLGATNDAIYALRGIPLPRKIGESVHAYADAYDVGSEANEESDDTVGFLGATDDNPMTGVGINEDGEEFIHVHAGIHGVGGLDPATYDWRNPVVGVTVVRVK